MKKIWKNSCGITSLALCQVFKLFDMAKISMRLVSMEVLVGGDGQGMRTQKRFAETLERRMYVRANGVDGRISSID
jgi:hypothetical protein